MDGRNEHDLMELKHFFRSRRISMKFISEYIGKSEAQVCNYFRGVRRMPEEVVEKLMKLRGNVERFEPLADVLVQFATSNGVIVQ